MSTATLSLPPTATPKAPRPAAPPVPVVTPAARANPSLVYVPTGPDGPSLYRWTLDEYYELGKLKVFQDKRTELVAGKLYVMTFPNEDHTGPLMLAANRLRLVFGEGYVVREEKGFVILPDSDVGPDIAVVPGTIRDYIASGKPTSALLIVEVSRTSRNYDLSEKAELYAKGGIEDYWVLDVAARRLTVFRRPFADPSREHGHWYASIQLHAEGEIVTPLAAPSAQIRVGDLLP